VSFPNENRSRLLWRCREFNSIKSRPCYSFPQGEAKRGDRERLSRAARPSLPARPRETCARSWAPSEGGRGSDAPGAPRTSPQTSSCRSRGGRWSHPPTAPSRRATRAGRRRTAKGLETEEATGNTAARGPWGSLERGCPRWCAPWTGGSSTPVHCLRQRAPPIPLGRGRRESRTRGETRRCFGEVVLH